MSIGVALAIGLVLLAANAFFVAAEFALISARRTAVEARAVEGSRSARTTLAAMENVSVMLAGAQLGITICSLGLGAIAEPALAQLIEPAFEALRLPEALVHPAAFTLALGIVVFLHVVFGEMVPKNIALAGPDSAAILLTPPLRGVVTVLRPAILGLNAVANLVLRMLRVVPSDEVASAFTREEVARLVEQSHREGLLDADERNLVSSAMSLADSPVRRIMLPVDALTTVPDTATALQIEHVAGTTGFSRLPVRGWKGHLVGYVHLKDILDVPDESNDTVIAAAVIRPLANVAANDGLRAALTTMQSSGAHLGAVSDEDGTVIGVVALEDVLEELVGEIRDGTRPS